MHLKAFLTTLVLAGLPAIAAAQCADRHEPADQQAMSCIPGTTWDAVTGTCVPSATS